MPEPKGLTMTSQAGDGRTARFLVMWETPSDPEAFDRHYRETHIPIARKLPGLRRYTLGRDVSPVRGEPYYMVADLEWDSMEELRAAFASEAGRATAADVELLRRFAPVRSMIIGTEDDVL